MDVLGEAVARSPEFLLKPHFEALGLEWDHETEEIRPRIINGKQSKGATHVGFSRDGDAKRSRFKDYALQAKLAEQILDRLYGKSRMAVDLAGESTIKLPDIPQTIERAAEVANILAQCGGIGSTDPPDPPTSE